MIITHLTRDLRFRAPFGAVPTGEAVALSLQIQESGQVLDCSLHYSYGLLSFRGSKTPMSPSGDSRQDELYECKIQVPDEYGLLFYWFEIRTEAGILYFGANPSKKDGSGITSVKKPGVLQNGPAEILPFQITVYDRAFKTPDWFKGCVLYQIFPDRFARSESFSFEKMKQAKAKPERIYHENWEEDVDYKGCDASGYLACDFFGGSLQGITEHLGYLEDLGVDAIYCNPIFESRSNHRYDTGDYEKVDPILGSEEDFSRLVQEASAHSIRIVLDGVFSHTGADSRYFNKYGRYDSPGAYQEAEGNTTSPYYSWYHFNKEKTPVAYDCWWGFPDLPCVNESNLDYIAYMLGKGGIVRSWLQKGVSGWRLDVSDELPDGFLRSLRRAVKSENADALILGEVWEDASKKNSYGTYRDFLFGSTHDCVMGYPFRTAVTGWLSGQIDASEMKDSLESIRENYPAEAFYCNMNLIGSHDVPRALTELAGKRQVMDRESQAAEKMSMEQRAHGERLLRLAMLMQFTYPGTPSIYYGDELAMEGYRDPFNRRPFPWSMVETDPSGTRKWLQLLIRFRKDHPVLKFGWLDYHEAKGDVVRYSRYFKDGIDALGHKQAEEHALSILINRSHQEMTLEIGEDRIVVAPLTGMIQEDGISIFTT